MGSLAAGIIAAVVAAVGSIVSGVATNVANERTNQANLDLTNKSWERDDSAVQRRKADLIAAGLSPTLAAGSAAGNTNPIAFQSNQKTLDFGGLMQAGDTLRNAQLDYLSRTSDLETAALNRDFLVAQRHRLAFENNLDYLKFLQNQKESNARIADMSFNQGFKTNQLSFQKEQAKANYELGQASHRLKESQWENELFDINWYHSQNRPRGWNSGFQFLQGLIADGIQNGKIVPTFRSSYIPYEFGDYFNKD